MGKNRRDLRLWSWVFMFCVFVSCRKKPLTNSSDDPLETFFRGSNRIEKHPNKWDHGTKKKMVKQFFDRFQSEESLEVLRESAIQNVKVPEDIEDDKKRRDEFIKYIVHKFFSFVLITDHFDESLILLKRQLCWDFADMVYIPLKGGRHKDRTKKYQADFVRRHRKWMVRLRVYLSH